MFDADSTFAWSSSWVVQVLLNLWQKVSNSHRKFASADMTIHALDSKTHSHGGLIHYTHSRVRGNILFSDWRNERGTSVPGLLGEKMSFIKLENEEVHKTDEEQCFLCGKQNSNDGPLQKCANCELIWFCSEDHYEVHRHKERCFPFLIKRSPKKGR